MRPGLYERKTNKAECTQFKCKPMPFPDGFIEFVTSPVKQHPHPVKEEYNMEREQRNYLDNRIYLTTEAKDIELSRAYGLLDDGHPKSAEEMIQRITEGKYILRPNNEDEDGWGHYAWERIRWRDPAMKEDRAGYKAAMATVSAARQKVQDHARLSPIDVAFKVFEEFEATTFH